MVETEKQRKARNLRYKKALVDKFNYDSIRAQLEEIGYNCDEVRYYFESDDETLLNALDGDEEEEYEFKIMFSELSAECEKLWEIIYNNYISENFDDFLCAVSKGTNYNIIGYDDYEEDYYKLTSYESEWGREECQKRLMRLTKQEIIKTGCQCFGIVTSFLNIQAKYDSLKAAFDILKDENTTFLEIIKEIEQTYLLADEDEFCDWKDSVIRFNNLVKALPDRLWIE